MTKEPSIARLWQTHYGRACTETDVEKMFQEFIPLQLSVLPDFCTLIPGVVATVAELKHRGLIFTTSTGYNREMTDICLKTFAAAGITPSYSICAAEVALGRPAPDMALRAMQAMGVTQGAAVIKIGDTISDIQEGLAAKTWSIGITATGNMLGLNLDEYTALPSRERQRRLALATEEMKAAGAHYVIERFSDLPELIDEINRRLAAGETP
jgi:phosphonoacetaldehyde hydrolase